MVDGDCLVGTVSSDAPKQLDQSGRNAAAGNGASPQGGFNALVPELDVSDIAASLHFWCDLLGFHIVYDRPAAGFAFLEREGAQVMLCQVNGEWVTGRWSVRLDEASIWRSRCPMFPSSLRHSKR
ncbi:VOC family protein [Neorhizobium sp. NPDC001467]|uniref:VOC family protein n=1 Tax=Neorhizobium sp. NPDC001467 TaxID=3390595 RepID=UPI003D05946C